MAVVKSNRSAIKLRIRKAKAAMMTPLCQQILADCNYFCPQDQGTLIASSLTHSRPEAGELIWNTVYARRRYYTGRPTHDVNPHAALMWCEVAHDRWGRDWNALADVLFKGGLE